MDRNKQIQEAKNKIKKADEINDNKYVSVHFGTIYKKLDLIDKENQENGKVILEVKNLLTNDPNTSRKGLIHIVDENSKAINNLIKERELDSARRKEQNLHFRVENLEAYNQKLKSERAVEKSQIKIIATVITIVGGAVFTFINKVLLK
jgi:hypothetical protein